MPKLMLFKGGIPSVSGEGKTLVSTGLGGPVEVPLVVAPAAGVVEVPAVAGGGVDELAAALELELEPVA
jgi:hypothetical protein